jgi:arylsulfatase A-like enzyme
MDIHEKGPLATSQKWLHEASTAVAFGLMCGLVIGVVRWATDHVARTYVSAKLSDVILSYLQFFINRNTLLIVAVFLVASMIFHFLQKLFPRLAETTLTFLRGITTATALLFLAVYEVRAQTWFPEAWSRRAFIYALLLGGSSLAALAYLWLRHRQSQYQPGKLIKLPTIGALAVVASINGAAFIAKQQAPQEKPNVIVILLDAVRFDHLGCYGYPRPTSPTIDAFAKEGLMFTQAISQSSYTKPVIASLFTSLYPSQHSVFRNTRHDAQGNFISDVLDDSFLTMAEYLHAADFNTVGFLEQAQLRHYMGFAQGFCFYKPDMGPAPEINRGFFQWLPINKHRQFFAYLHYLDAHAPYVPPTEYRDMFGSFDQAATFPERVKDWQKFKAEVTDGNLTLTPSDGEHLKALYDAEIRALDENLAALFAKLKKENVYENSLIILTADHGDEFLDHGSVDHAHTLYDELLRVPLIIRFPKSASQGTIHAQVQTIDILPTILDVLKLPADPHWMGRSLLMYQNGANGHEPAPVFSERADLISLRSGTHKYIYNTELKTGELYDLQNDPGEKNDISAAEPQIANRMQGEVLQWLETMRKATPKESGVTIDQHSVKELRSLGYIR